MAIIRLQKYLADCGIASRRNSEKIIKEGEVKVNGAIVTALGSKVDTEKDKVEYQNKAIKPENKFIYIILNKPKGYVTSLNQEDKKTIMELINIKERVFPVGRLDENSEGLILLTNDGDLAYKLTHPKFEHEKEYYVKVDKPVTEAAIKTWNDGLIIEGKKTSEAKIKKISSREFTMIIHEGRNRQVRKMCGALGYTVRELRRLRMGPISLESLQTGKWRYLSNEEIKKLKE